MQSCWFSAARNGHNVVKSFGNPARSALASSAKGTIAISPPTRASLMSSSVTSRHSHQAAIAFGSNLGNKVRYIEGALSEMRKAGLNVLKTSPIYETKPMYYENQDTFLNGVCQIQTEAEPLALLDTLQSIETKLDRKREIQKGPRTIDLDMILYDDHEIYNPRLEVPHKLLHEREFVLRPLNDIMPEAVVRRDSTAQTVSDMYRDLQSRDESMSPVTHLTDHLPLIRATDATRPTQTMAILNLTPDSFSDGGVHDAHEIDAILQTVRDFVDAGASIIDIGGQSTRPNAELLSPAVELNRILPAIHAIRSAPSLKNIAISIDTFYAQVAREAIMAGADIINDVSAGMLDQDMLPTVANLGKTVILMHMRGNPQTMTKLTQYPGGVVNAVSMELSSRVEAAEAAGIPRWRIILDPGIGFAKNQNQNLELLRSLQELRDSPNHANLRGLPWLVGISRKGFLGEITGAQEADKRLMGTAAGVGASIAGGADIVRVHDVTEMAEFVKMADAIYRRTLDG